MAKVMGCEVLYKFTLLEGNDFDVDLDGDDDKFYLVALHKLE